MATCMICNREMKAIGHNHVYKLHSMTVSEYKKLFPGCVMIDESTINKYKLHTIKLVKEGKFGSKSSSIHLAFLKVLRDNFPNINFENEYTIKYYTVDIACPEKKIVIEVYGDWFHNRANKPYGELTPIQQKNFKNDKSKSTFLFRKGWQKLVIWEYDIRHNIEECIQKVSEILNNGVRLPNLHIDLHKKCEHCGAVIPPNKHKYYSNDKKYCSNQCKYLAQSRKRDDDSQWRKHCKQCGAKVGRRNRTFCSHECQKTFEAGVSYREILHKKISISIKNSAYHAGRRKSGRIWMKCDCGKDFWVHHKRLKQNVSGKFWCCRKCYMTYHNEYFRREHEVK